jgi:hypothetical protein
VPVRDQLDGAERLVLERGLRLHATRLAWVQRGLVGAAADSAAERYGT